MRNLSGPKRRLAVDIDSTLTTGPTQWWDGEFGQPHPEAVAWVREQYKNGHTILLYTARPERVRAGTEAWMDRHNVPYHALVMGKLSADVYVDDKAVPATIIRRLHEQTPRLEELADVIDEHLGESTDE